jgi:hypothetical protein
MQTYVVQGYSSITSHLKICTISYFPEALHRVYINFVDIYCKPVVEVTQIICVFFLSYPVISNSEDRIFS